MALRIDQRLAASRIIHARPKQPAEQSRRLCAIKVCPDSIDMGSRLLLTVERIHFHPGGVRARRQMGEIRDAKHREPAATARLVSCPGC